MSTVQYKLARRLESVSEQGNKRSLQIANGDLLDFCSNDYLGFACEAAVGGLLPSGSGASRLLAGTSEMMLNVESELSKFYQTESTTVFSSGYQANLGLLAAVAERSDYILYDELVHASVRDGVRLAHARSAGFDHNSVDSLIEKLSRIRGKVSGIVYVCVESLYSMDGDVTPLKDFVQVCRDFDAALIVDEAHSSGIFGPSGEGLVVELGLVSDVFARVHTFGKAIGLHGACVVGSNLLKESIVNFSRPFIYTTAPPDHFFKAILERHREVAAADERRERLQEISKYFDSRFSVSGASLQSKGSPIKAVICPGNTFCRRIASILQEHGFDVRAVLSPTVPAGSERLRICLHSFNTKTEVDTLLVALSNCMDEDE